jgi:hypothetical protein
LQTEHLAVDGCSTKAPCGGAVAGRSPVDHGKQGLKRSIVTDAGGVPLSAIPAAANRRDGRDPGHPGLRCRARPPAGPAGSAPRRRLRLPDLPEGPAPAGHGRADRHPGRADTQAGRRWPVQRTHAWGNQDGKLCWCTKRRRLVVAFWLALATAAIVLGRLVRRVWARYRWDARPRRRHNTSTGRSPHASAGGPLIGADDGCASECAATG